MIEQFRPSVCQSATIRHGVNKTKCIVEIVPPPNSFSLIFLKLIAVTQFDGVAPNRSAQNRKGIKIQ